MRELTELLDAILDQTTFDSRSAKEMTSAQLRDAFERNGWHDEEKSSAREAEPHIPDELLSQLNNCLRSLLKEYITSGHLRFGLGQPQETDFIGHAFPINEHGHPISYIPPEMIFCPNYFDLAYISRVSTVADFTKGVIKGAAVLGSERVTHLLSDWLEGKPVKYRTSARLNGPPVKAPLNPFDGVHIEPLPLSSDRLDASLPRRRGTSENVVVDYLGRTLVSIDSEVKPALFRPEARPSAQDIQVKPIGGVNIATVCQALSLESDDYVDAGLYWNDYQELDAFSLGVDETTWSMGNARVRSWSSPVTWGTELFTGVTTLEFKGEQPLLDISEEQLARTLAALKTLNDSDKTHIAVSRWVKSKDPYVYLVDRFIDLRIVLECLYVQNESKGIKKNIVCYGPAHLADSADPKQHKRIKGDLKNAYETACDAVHTGSLEERYEDKVRQTLRQIDFNEWDDWAKERDGWNAWIEENKNKIKAWYPYIDTDLLYDVHRGKCGNFEDFSEGKYKEDIIDEYISKEYTRQSGSKLLSTAQDLCRRGILKLLKEGPPADWGDLIRGVENE